jgi:uncharacterized protein (DUF433 family)
VGAEERDDEMSVLTRRFVLGGRKMPPALRLYEHMPTTNPELTPTRSALGTGVYGLPELRAFVALEGTREDGEHVLSWLKAALNPVRHRPRAADYSFSDLVSLFVVRELLRKGVKPHKIREAEAWLRETEKTDRPFVRDDIKTDGVEVFYRDELIPTQIEAASRRGQQTMREPIQDRLTSVGYEGGSAAYWKPAPGVMIDPRVQFGTPVVIGTRVPTEAVSGVARKLDVERAVRRFKLSTEHVQNAIAFEDRLASLS